MYNVLGLIPSFISVKLRPMGRFREESLQRLKERVDLVELVRGYVDLKRAGASYKACCPFHDEKTPSFVIQKGDTHFHCFGCQAHGDAIEFLMRHQQLSFVEAVETLGERFGVTLERTEEEKGPSRAKLKELLNTSAEAYHQRLLHDEEAMNYLANRGLDRSFVERFRLGLAPGEPMVQGDRFLLKEAGLLTKDGRRDFFRERILFPICDATGSVIGFSGRKYRESTFGGKYVNSPETPLFRKSRVLFGLHHSRRRIAKEKRCLVVEGQIDALRLIHAGWDLAVAGQGTAFGSGQVEELVKLGVRKAMLLMDGDSAGREAARKIGDLFQREGVEVRVARLPEGQDPDTTLNEGGIGALREFVASAPDYLSFLVSQSDLSTPAAKAEAVRRLSAQIREWPDPVMVHESLRHLAALMSLPESALGVDFGARPAIHMRQKSSVGGVEVDPDRVLEMDVLRLIVGDKRRREWAAKELRVDLFRTVPELFSAIVEEEDLLSVAARSDLVEELFSRKVNPKRADQIFPQAVQKLLDRGWLEERQKLSNQLRSGELTEEESLEVARKFNSLERPTCNFSVIEA